MNMEKAPEELVRIERLCQLIRLELDRRRPAQNKVSGWFAGIQEIAERAVSQP